VVTNQYRVDSLHVLSPKYEKWMEWEPTWSASITEKAREAQRPGGASGKRRRLRQSDDNVDFLPVSAQKERKQQAWEATGTSSVTERGGEAPVACSGNVDFGRRMNVTQESNMMENKR
jgi:hypothetical protein